LNVQQCIFLLCIRQRNWIIFMKKLIRCCIWRRKSEEIICASMGKYKHHREVIGNLVKKCKYLSTLQSSKPMVHGSFQFFCNVSIILSIKSSSKRLNWNKTQFEILSQSSSWNVFFDLKPGGTASKTALMIFGFGLAQKPLLRHLHAVNLYSWHRVRLKL